MSYAMTSSNFWDNNYYNNPPLTPEMILAAQALLQVTLPQAYIDLLKISNGGYTKGFEYVIDIPTNYVGCNIPLPELFGIVTDESHETTHNILHTEYISREWGLPVRQVLLSGEGPSWLTLDYRDSDSPLVRWIDVESDEDILVAESFEVFIEGLVPANYDEE